MASRVMILMTVTERYDDSYDVKAIEVACG